MARAQKTGKTGLRFPQLALADWMNEKADCRFAVANTERHAFPGLRFYEVAEGKAIAIASPARRGTPEFLDRIGGKIDIDHSPLVEAGALLAQHSRFRREDGADNGFNTFMGQYPELGSWQHGSWLLLRVHAPAAEWWAVEGAVAFAALKAKRDRERAKVGRTVIIGANAVVHPGIPASAGPFPAGFRHPLPDLRVMRPTWKAKVVKEGKDRVYVQDIVRLRDPVPFGDEQRDVIKGRAPNQYVDTANIMADGVSDAAVARFTALDSEMVADFHRAADKALAEAIGPLLELHTRTVQSQAMYADLFREAAEGGRGKKS